MRGQRAEKIYNTFDEWLINRLGMAEQEFRCELKKRLPYYNYEIERPEAVVAIYKKKYQEEMSIIASEKTDLTFLEWMQIYKHHTPATFHEMCVGTGISSREETLFMDSFKKQWKQRHEALIAGNCPFENKED